MVNFCKIAGVSFAVQYNVLTSPVALLDLVLYHTTEYRS